MEKIEEQLTDILPPSQRSSAKHRVLVTYSNPSHTMVTKRKEKQQTHLRVPATDKRGNSVYKAEAEELAKKHMKKKGYKVHEVTHVGLVNEEQEVAEETLKEYGDTPKGQKMLTKVQKRAVDRVTSKKADTDPKYAKKNQDTANRAWDRMGENVEEGRDAYKRDEYSSKQGFGRRHREDDEYHTPDPTTTTHRVGFHVSKDGGEKHHRTVTISNSRRSPEEAKSAARAHLEKQGYKIHEEVEDVTEAETYDYHMQRAQSAEKRGDMKAKVLHLKRAQAASNDRLGMKEEIVGFNDWVSGKTVKTESVFQSKARLRLADALRKEQEKREKEREAEEARREKPEAKSEKNDKD